MFLRVTRVSYVTGYRLRLEFNDGSARDVDLEAELHGEVFEPLRDLDLFKQVTCNPDTNTIAWPTGADLAAEYLHEIGRDVEKIA